MNLKNILCQILGSSDVTKGYKINELFNLVYGRQPSQEELSKIDGSCLSQHEAINAIRLLISTYDQQTLKTAFRIRHEADNIEFLSLGEFSLAIDKYDISVGLPIKSAAFDPHLTNFYKNKLKPGMTFVDIGANIGFYSMLAASLVGENGKVFSFEPNSENCRLILLSKNKNKFNNVQLFPLALTDTISYALFSNHLGSNGGIIPDTSERLIDSTCQVVPTNRLDNLIDERIDFIKIDIEGAEGLALIGALSLVTKYKPIILSEFSMEMLPRVSGIDGKEYLLKIKNSGYNCFMIDKKSYNLIDKNEIDSFIDNYGEFTRIEDLVFLPK